MQDASQKVNSRRKVIRTSEINTFISLLFCCQTRRAELNPRRSSRNCVPYQYTKCINTSLALGSLALSTLSTNNDDVEADKRCIREQVLASMKEIELERFTIHKRKLENVCSSFFPLKRPTLGFQRRLHDLCDCDEAPPFEGSEFGEAAAHVPH